MVLLWSSDWNKVINITNPLIESFGLGEKKINLIFWARWAVFRVSIPRRRRSWIRRNKAMIGSRVNRRCLLTFPDCLPVSCPVIYQSSYFGSFNVSIWSECLSSFSSVSNMLMRIFCFLFSYYWIDCFVMCVSSEFEVYPTRFWRSL